MISWSQAVRLWQLLLRGCSECPSTAEGYWTVRVALWTSLASWQLASRSTLASAHARSEWAGARRRRALHRRPDRSARSAGRQSGGSCTQQPTGLRWCTLRCDWWTLPAVMRQSLLQSRCYPSATSWFLSTGSSEPTSFVLFLVQREIEIRLPVKDYSKLKCLFNSSNPNE